MKTIFDVSLTIVMVAAAMFSLVIIYMICSIIFEIIKDFFGYGEEEKTTSH